MEAAALVGLNERDFWATTPRYLAAMLDAYERRQQHDYEVARYTTYLYFAGKLPKGKSLRVADMGLFGWEKETEKQRSEMAKMSHEEFMKRLAAMDAAIERMEAEQIKDPDQNAALENQ